MHKFAKMPSNSKTMPDDESNPKKPGLSPDKLIQGVLSRLGETFDGLLGRQSKASSLATSELIARTKKMLDMQLRDLGEKGKFVPHLIQLKVEWGKFSTDSPESLKTLENELLAAVIDHINDHRYLTFAPLKITAKPDYFVSGIHIITSFGEAGKEDGEIDLSVTMPDIKAGDLTPVPKSEKPKSEIVRAKFSLHDMEKEVTLRFAPGQRLNVGRTRENDLALEHGNVSKQHASLYFNAAGELTVSDVGSSNGTFINKERLAYGKAFPIKEGDMVEFGTVAVFFARITPEPEETVEDKAPETTAEERDGAIRIELNNSSEL
jgi:hypothetical protein